MKTYLLTEKDIELLREEFCISKLQSDTLDEILSGLTSYVAFDEIPVETGGHLTLEDLKETVEYMYKNRSNG